MSALRIFRPETAAPSLLSVGQVVSYSDAANPHREGVVVEAHEERYGQRLVWVDSESGRACGESRVSRRQIEGPGGWRLENWLVTAERVAQLTEQQAAYKADQSGRREAKLEAQRQQRDRGQAWLAENRPEWATSVIVAELHEDTCDSMTDYFNSKVKRVVLLAWSKHNRNLFSEMRKAAAKFSETAHLATADESAEHRENYSMGRGMFLQTGSGYSGWRVEKWNLSWKSIDEVAGDLAARELLEQ